MIQQIRATIEGVQAVAEVAEAATATGSPMASATIALLGAELLVFIGKTIATLDDDIDNVREGQQRYAQNESTLIDRSARVSNALGDVQYA